MAKLAVNNFRGEAPRYDPKLLLPDQAASARDCDLLSGKFRPINDTSIVESVPAGSESIYYWAAPGTWLSWTTDVDVVRSMVAHDRYDRIYLTGDGAPQVRGQDGGAKTFDLGLPKPSSAPTVTTQAASNVFTRAWYYAYEEPDATRVDQGTLTEGSDIIKDEESEAEVWTVPNIPDKDAATADAVFVVWFVGTSPGGVNLGILYPDISKYSTSSDFTINGAKGRAAQVNQTQAGWALALDDPDPSTYSVERTYVETFVSAWGEEGPPSDASVVTKVSPAQDAVITSANISVTGSYQVTKKRLYRTVSSNAGTVFLLVDELDLTSATITDSKLDAELSIELVSDGDGSLGASWSAPPADLAGLVELPGGILSGFVGRDVYFSEPYQPHAWPVKYIESVDFDVVAMGVSGNSLVVGTKGMPYAINIIDPESSTVTRIETNQPCVSKRGLMDVGSFVAYPSNNGIVFVHGTNASLVTEPFYTRKEWTAINPSTMRSGVFNRNLYMWTDTAGLIFDLDEKTSGFVNNTLTVSGVYSDLETDELYAIVGENIVKWEGSTTTKTGYWKSFEMTFDKTFTPRLYRVVASAYPVNLEFWAEGALVKTVSVPDTQVHTVPATRPELHWQVAVSTESEVDQIIIADASGEFRE
tara:strand:+ start:8070 stop:10001 length:1932 start_codon:yes stop_codon:yes gene_type:complete